MINRPRVYKKENPNSQTKGKMEKEIVSFVLNPEIPDTPNNHRAVYLAAHPGETLTQNDIIHHINGYHQDNRPENLIKLTSHSDHRLRHIALIKEGAEK
jgi:hypothetical protein